MTPSKKKIPKKFPKNSIQGTKWRNRGGGAGNPSNGGVLVDEEKEKKDKKLPCPYLRFVASFLPQHLIYQTKPDFYTETPTWESIDLQVMDIPNLMYLKTQHMILLVVSSEGRVEPLGQSVLSLDDIGPLPKRFNQVLFLHGESVGFVAGSVSLFNKAEDLLVTLDDDDP
eukprot:TRINITY_DN2776_c1_g1_i4.p1 TRINITY_DN2776_c1_g1~~TRINITY_DN2776_c1_g1_i4.p1  ORF type:complete len:170 (-),score=59.90 TRINITY_DN2776_c1_g1_i4:128-637(-)